jgi:hypothetical protein
MTLPNFLIIGAARSGTTSLYTYLKEHPEIYMSPVKEASFFCLNGKPLDYQGPGDKATIVQNSFYYLKDYESLFKNVKNEKAIGEASPMYMYYAKKTIPCIKRYIPNVKLIAILRNPVERAYSAYSLMFSSGKDFGLPREPCADFGEALEAEEQRINMNWGWIYHYKKCGFYYSQLKYYYKNFNKNQIRIYLYEDLKARPRRLLEDIFDFLEVNKKFRPKLNQVKRSKPGKIVRLHFFHSMLTKSNISRSFLRILSKPFISFDTRQKIRNSLIGFNLKKYKPPLTEEVRKKLLNTYRDDILRLQKLINRDLSGWLK